MKLCVAPCALTAFRAGPFQSLEGSVRTVCSQVWRREGRCCMMTPWKWEMLVRVTIEAKQMAQLSVRSLLIHLIRRGGECCELWDCLSIACCPCRRDPRCRRWKRRAPEERSQLQWRRYVRVNLPVSWERVQTDTEAGSGCAGPGCVWPWLLFAQVENRLRIIRKEEVRVWWADACVMCARGSCSFWKYLEDWPI